MGGGASANQAITDSLPPAVLSQFVRYELECEANGFTAAETFLYLSKQYDDILKKVADPDTADTVLESFSQVKGPGSKQQTLRCLTHLTADEVMEIIMSTSDDNFTANNHKEKKDREFYEDDTAKRFDEINNLQLNHKIDIHSTDLVNKAFLNIRLDGNYSGKIVPESTSAKEGESKNNDGTGSGKEIDETSPDISSATVPSTRSSSPNTHYEYVDNSSVTDKNYECELCKIGFKYATELTAHVKHSSIHAANKKVADLAVANKYRKEKQQYTFKATTITQMQKAFGRRDVSLAAAQLTRNQLRWKNALSATIIENTKAHYSRVTEKMCFIPNDVSVLHMGNKVFYRHSGTVTVNICMYVHSAFHLVELVPHVVHITHHEVGGDVSHKQDSDVHTQFVPLPRIYLEYNALLGCVMGTHKQESELLAHHYSSVDEYANKYTATLHRSRSVDVCVNNVMSSFISSHLRMVKPAKKHHHHHHGSSSRRGSTKQAHQLQQQQVSHTITALASGNYTPSRVASRANSVETINTDMLNFSNCESLSNSAANSPCASPRQDGGLFAPIGNTSSIDAYDAPHLGLKSSSVKTPSAAAVVVDHAKEELDIIAHIKDYTVFFDDTDLLKVVDLSPVCRAPPDELVPILGVAVDQINVFYEPSQNK